VRATYDVIAVPEHLIAEINSADILAIEKETEGLMEGLLRGMDRR
jgi:hypothetical protein